MVAASLLVLAAYFILREPQAPRESTDLVPAPGLHAPALGDPSSRLEADRNVVAAASESVIDAHAEAPGQGPRLLVPALDDTRVYGSLWGPDGELLLRHRIGFQMQGYPPLSAYSDEEGRFDLLLPDGDYDVLYFGQDTRREVGSLVGDLHVQGERELYYDVAVFGDRQVKGRFTVELPPELAELLGDSHVLLLELRNFWDPTQLIAEGGTTIPDDDKIGPDGQVVEKSADALKQGEFVFRGLWPDRYILRVLFGTNAQGQALYTDLEIDLTNDNLDLGHRVFKLTEFKTHN